MTPPRRSLWVIGLIVAMPLIGDCYRPGMVDCALACGDGNSCPDGMSCRMGRCTRGATCALAVAAGARHACAIRGASVACWGNNEYGQTTAHVGPDAVRPVAVDIGADQAVTALAAGGRHTCAAFAGDGAHVACWGDDALGQLGGTGGGPRPSAISFGSGHRVTAIVAGLYHTCVIDSDNAQTDAGAVRCWGDNRFNQLGWPAGAVAAPGGVPPAVDLGIAGAIAIAAGAYHTCAVRATDGGISCWGWNDYGQLGADGAGAPVEVPIARHAVQIAAGGFHTCAILDAGDLTRRGADAAGQIGAPPATCPSQGCATCCAPGMVDLGTGRSARAISLGASHTCALLDDASVKCWGLNLDGQLGIGDTRNRGGSPDDMGDALSGVALGGNAVSALSAGTSHTCVVQASDVKCWGFNGSGRLGTGDTKTRGDVAASPIVPVAFGR